MEETSIEPRRKQGRLWRVIRVILLIVVGLSLYQQQSIIACSILAVILGMGYYTNFHLRDDEVEKPYYRLWFKISDAFVAIFVMGIILWQHIKMDEQFPRMLLIGWILLLVRLILFSTYHYSLLRQGKETNKKSFWSKAANLSITVTMIIYVLNLERFQEISMGITMLLMFASSISFLYFFYRDKDHRKPISIATQITVSRIILTPVFILVFFPDKDLLYQNNHAVFKWLALIMVILFMLTDFLDGYLARKMNEVSTLGKYLDPFSDKISNMTIFLCFMTSGYASVWMVALIYFREASVETLRTLAANEKIVIAARQSGKWKTAIQGAGVLIILTGALEITHLIPHWGDVMEYLPYTIMSIITAVTVLSGVDYFVASRDVLKKYI